MDRKKTISLIYDFFSEQGGLEKLMITHANLLKESGYNVEILTFYKKAGIEEMLGVKGIKIRDLSAIKNSSLFASLFLAVLGLSKIKKVKTDLFVSYSAFSNFTLRKINTKKAAYLNHYPNYLYLKGKKRIVWANNSSRKTAAYLALLFGKRLKRLDKKLISKNKLLFVNSEFMKKKLEKIYMKKMFVSYPPIFNKIKKVESKNKRGRFIFSCGRIIPDKNIELLVRSSIFMKNRIPVVISGQGDNEYLKKLKRLVKKIKANVVFLGNISLEDLIKNYSNADVFAFATPNEDFGLIIAESLACGTPCVIWGDGAGPTEQIINTKNGFLAKPYDIKDFAKKLDMAIESKLKKRNQKEILDSANKFSETEIKKEFIGRIKKLLN